jgi:hypothetical protein
VDFSCVQCEYEIQFIVFPLQTVVSSLLTFVTPYVAVFISSVTFQGPL